jgi:hypothetical protein
MSKARKPKKPLTDEDEGETEVVKVESLAKMPEDIVWETNTSNKLINTSVLTDDLRLIIKIDGKEYEVRSPDYRIVDDFTSLRNKYKKKKVLTKKETEELEAVQRVMVEDMIPDLDFEDRSVRIDATDIGALIGLCWRFHSFLTRKSVAIENLSISSLED